MADPAVRVVVPARFAGRCLICSEPIEVGDPIDRVGSKWVHATCTDVPEEDVLFVRLSDGLDVPIRDVEDAMSREYPPPVKEPCNDCPWRRESTPGWLGPYDAERWLEIVHSDAPIACHQMISEGGGWEDALQCQGAAIFRANVLKEPRNPTVARGPEDRERVFATSAEFGEHHSS